MYERNKFDLPIPHTDEVDDPFSLQSLIKWLETKTASEVYCWMGHCMWEQYGEHIGLGKGSRAYVAAHQGFVARHGADYCIAIREPRTFGAALERARSAAREQRERGE